jgi:hypothetical protein
MWDFGRRTMAFMRDGHHILWCAADARGPQPCLHAMSIVMMAELLHFESVFAEPKGLPSQRGRSHQIRLLPGMELVVVRPYRYAHAQKTELERQCGEMLEHGVIRPSSSAFLAPVLLVKKSNNSWRFCVDYRALNEGIVKDKFSIPVELLDELRGSAFFTKLDLRSSYHRVLMHPDDVDKTAFRTH